MKEPPPTEERGGKDARLIREGKEAEGDLEALLEQLPVGVLFRNAEGVYTRVNRAALAHVDLEPADVIGKTGGFLLEHAKVVLDGETVTDGDPNVSTQTEVEHHDLVITGSDGEPREMRVTSGPVLLEGEPHGHVVVLLDVTEQKRLERRLCETQKLEAIGKLAGGVAHDFNNLLSVILNYARFIYDDVKDARQRADVEEIIRAGEDASRLTRQLLTFSRRDVARVTRVRLDAAIHGLEKMVRRLLPESVDLDIDLKPMPEVLIDPLHIEQVLMDLILNANDAMRTGGHLSIKGQTVELDPDNATEVAPGRYALLEVQDDGEGVPPDIRAKIFEPLFTTKPFGKGTGMGLATARQIVVEAGGAIEVTSQVGKGSIFSIYLPAAPPIVDQEKRRATAVETATILVVEDEAAVRDLAVRILEGAGHQVQSAVSGKDALALVARHRFDLMVCDVVMPELGGVDLAREVDVPALFMSGYPDETIEEYGLGIDPDRFISKPLHEEELLARVQVAIGGLPPPV
jgi:PAS domain S-box-containing protein